MTGPESAAKPAGLPRHAGVSLKPEHFSAVRAQAEGSGTDAETGTLWFEVHPENYFVAGGPRLTELCAIAERHPLSLHGVSASLAGPDPVPDEHVKSLKRLCDLLKPAQVSEHFAWSVANDHYWVNLLPAHRTDHVRQVCLDNIDRLQNGLQRQILIENPAHYLAFRHDYEEPDFLQDIIDSSGCGLLLDLNNLYLSQHNIGMQASAYLDRINFKDIGEIHLAGHSIDPRDPDLLIDSHDGPVSDPVFALLAGVLQQAGPKPVLIEWDAQLPSFDELLAQRQLAESAIERCQDSRVA